jgi:YidC/Oxa1 family membrane protein insertase
VIEVWNSLVRALGSMLAAVYSVIPSYILAIVLLTVAVRVILLPLTIKQTRSMQAMQKLQPKVKELQRKHKGNKQKLNEELMKLYKEHQVNPLGGCLPLVLQLPVFFALYRLLTGALPGNLPGTRYLPEGSSLAADIGDERVGLFGVNLSCPPIRAGRGEAVVAQGTEAVSCGDSVFVAIPIFLLVAAMVFTTWYQQRQMQRATQGPQAPQMQLMGKILPVFLGFISLQISSGVLIYWVTTNTWQIGQQYVMLRSRQAEEPAKPAKAAQGDGKAAGPQAKPKPKKAAGEEKPKKAAGETPAKGASSKGKSQGPRPSGGRPGGKRGRRARGRKKRSKR